jgi:hypothetical protein
MDVSSLKTKESLPPDIMAALVEDLVALQESVPEGYSVVLNVSPLVGTTVTALVCTPSKTLWLTHHGTILGEVHSTLPDNNAECVENLPKQQELFE